MAFFFGCLGYADPLGLASGAAACEIGVVSLFLCLGWFCVALLFCVLRWIRLGVWLKGQGALVFSCTLA